MEDNQNHSTKTARECPVYGDECECPIDTDKCDPTGEISKSKGGIMNQTAVQSRFKCLSGDGSLVIVDTPPTYPGDITISITRGKQFVIVSPDVARQTAAAIMDCASRAVLENQHVTDTQTAERLSFYYEADERIGALDAPLEYHTKEQHDAWLRGILDAQEIVKQMCEERGL